MKWEIPSRPRGSSREPTSIHRPIDIDLTAGIDSEMILSPFGRMVLLYRERWLNRNSLSIILMRLEFRAD
jgi:hypothetical protein